MSARLDFPLLPYTRYYSQLIILTPALPFFIFIFWYCLALVTSFGILEAALHLTSKLRTISRILLAHVVLISPWYCQAAWINQGRTKVSVKDCQDGGCEACAGILLFSTLQLCGVKV